MPADLPLDAVTHLIAAANAARGHHDLAGAPPPPDLADAEAELEARFRVSHALAVYGTLAPGRSNHHVVAPLGGTWTPGTVHGDLSPEGWGATLGYPALRPRTGGPVVAVQVLTADGLPAAWARLDDFEGPGYRRILVPVFAADGSDARRLQAVANLYAAADGGPGTPQP